MNDSARGKVTILVNSCDLYEDAWKPFFYLLKKHWPGCPYEIVLHTETKPFQCEYFNIQTIQTGKELSWTGRLRAALQQIDSEFILFFLEDFFLLTDVKTEAFEKALSIITADPTVGLIHFTPSEKEMPVPCYDLEHAFYELPVKKRTLRTRVAISLFRKDYFLKLLYGDETPWQYERESHIRSMFAGYKIFRQDYSLYPPAFSYFIDASIGVGITAKKWLSNNQILFESEGLRDVNYQRLGILEKDHLTRQQEANRHIQTVGFKNWIYANIKHPIKRAVRHVWILQDIKNLKKYREYKRYYKHYQPSEPES